MKVLIGIVTHNRSTILPKAIASALAQDYPHKEVVIFDDASTDNTMELQIQFPEVRWHHCSEKQGYLPCRNYLMQNTDADFYVSLDDDAWFIQGDEITQGINALKNCSHIAAVAYDILSPDEPNIKQRERSRPTHMFIGCGHILRLSTVRNVGFYVPNPGFYGSEEKDLCLRLLDQQYEIFHLPGVHVWHDKTLIARDIPKQHRSGVCNDLVFTFRRCPFPMIMGVLPIKLLNHLRFSLTHHLFFECLAGIKDFLYGLPSLLETRSPVKSNTFHKFLQRSHITL